jgi:hypothetical protein
MTDPVTKVDMEGVLSSVRKLVSEGAPDETTTTGDDAATADRASDGPDGAPAQDGGRPAKLVLTPAQRVTEGRSVATATPDTRADSASATSDRAAAPLVLERPITTVQRRSGGGDAGKGDAATPAVARAAEGGRAEQPSEGPVGDAVTPEPADQDVAALRTAAESPVAEETVPEDRAAGTASDDAGSDARHPSGLDALDEAALRALVAEIVREELQGALGDRVTRNVRKLVRQEVYRHLSTREFD